MPRLIPHASLADREVVPLGDNLASDCYLRLVELSPGESIKVELPAFESICVVLSGSVNIQVAQESFEAV